MELKQNECLDPVVLEGFHCTMVICRIQYPARLPSESNLRGDRPVIGGGSGCFEIGAPEPRSCDASGNADFIERKYR